MDLHVVAVTAARDRLERAGSAAAAAAAGRHRIVVGEDVVDLVVTGTARGRETADVCFAAAAAATAFVLVFLDVIVFEVVVIAVMMVVFFSKTEVDECAVPGIA
jgi:hypothetical protein